MSVSMHYILCLVTLSVKVLHNGRLLRFSKRTVCWCTFSWGICNQNGHFIRCIQSISFQGYDVTHMLEQKGPLLVVRVVKHIHNTQNTKLLHTVCTSDNY